MSGSAFISTGGRHCLNYVSSKTSGQKVFILNPWAIVEFGPWGRNDGGITLKKFELDDSSSFSNIRIAVDLDRIHSVIFTYKDQNGDEIASPRYGGSGGVDQQFSLGDDVEMTLIAGTYDDSGITSLSISTRKGVTHGPYGTTGSKSFSVPVNDGKVIGFFGSHVDYIDNVGVIVQPAGPK